MLLLSSTPNKNNLINRTKQKSFGPIFEVIILISFLEEWNLSLIEGLRILLQ